MSEFLTKLDVELREDSDKIFVLKSPLIYKSDLVGIVEVPEGFQTDFASVPRFPIIYSFWGGRSHHESCIHDYLYRIDSIPQVGFWLANEVFFEAMECRNKSFYIRYPMYWGVIIGGYSSFHEKRVEDKL